MPIIIKGIPELDARLQRSKTIMPRMLKAAMIQSLQVVENSARATLDLHVYARPRYSLPGPTAQFPNQASPPSGDLRNSFASSVVMTDSFIEGYIENFDWKAKWFEHGTGMHGSVGRRITIVPHRKWLTWMEEGHRVWVREIHTQGMEALHFMQYALEDNLDLIDQIFREHIAAAFRTQPRAIAPGNWGKGIGRL